MKIVVYIIIVMRIVFCICYSWNMTVVGDV